MSVGVGEQDPFSLKYMSVHCQDSHLTIARAAHIELAAANIFKHNFSEITGSVLHTTNN